MKTRTKRIIIVALTGAMVLGALSGAILAGVSGRKQILEASAIFSPSQTYTSHDGDTYYDDLDTSKTGDSFLEELRSYNLTRRKKTMGYSTGGTSALNSDFIYTDYDTSDPSTLKTDKNGQVYGTVISSFYSYTPCTGFNKEHVWPNTHGGNLVEKDVHMARPTISTENSNRGHSYFVDGMNSNKNEGWDPYKAGYDKNSRGEAARIIFYCMVATDQLTLEAGHSNSSKTSNKKMGDLVDLLKWNADVPVTDREKNRNEGAEYLQGNRNPFIDHPEYACKIWGNTNSETKEICKSTPPTPTVELESISISSAAVDEYEVGDTFVKPQVTAYYSNETSKNVTNSCTFSGYNMNVSGSQTVTVSYTEDGVTKTASYTITVKKQEVVELQKIEITSAKVTNYEVGDLFVKPEVTATYSNGSTSVVTNRCIFSGYNLNVPGDQTVTVSFSENDVSKTLTYIIHVEQVSTRILESISITNPENEYIVGDEFVKPIVMANYSDGTTVNVTENCTFSGYDLDETGEQTVLVSYEEGDIEVNDSYSIIVSEDDPEIIHVESLTISPTLKSVKVGDTFQISVNVQPTNADNKSVSYVSYDEQIAAVSSRGLVTAVSAGTTEIHVVTADGHYSQVCYVEVTEKEDEPQVMSIEISGFPEKTVYYVNQEFIPFGMKVVAHYDDEAFDCLVTNDCKFSYDFSKANEKSKVTVTYAGCSASINVEVKEGEATIQEEAIDFSYEFRTIVNDESAVTKTVWTKAENEFKDLDPEIKEIYRTASYTTTRAKDNEIIKCVKSYDRVLESNPDFNDFMGRKQTTDPTNEFEVDMKRVILIIAIVVVFIVAIILVIVIPVKAHKRKAKAS